MFKIVIIMRYIILILCFASIGFISGCNTEASSVLHDTPQKNLFFHIPNTKFTIDAIPNPSCFFCDYHAGTPLS